MSVYIDRANLSFGRMQMCHMLADTLDELHAMADRVGLKRQWFQPASTPHYDVCQAKRRLALAAGAIEVSNRQLVSLIRKWRAAKLCPRCKGQKYDRGSCGLCHNTGLMSEATKG